MPAHVYVLIVTPRHHRLNSIVSETQPSLALATLHRSHPPLGKLVFVLVCKLVGYDYNKCGFSNISDDYAPDCKYLWLRGTAAFFGTLTAPLFYLITRNWGGSILAGVVAACCFTFDGLNTGEDRLILVSKGCEASSTRAFYPLVRCRALTVATTCPPLSTRCAAADGLAAHLLVCGVAADCAALVAQV